MQITLANVNDKAWIKETAKSHWGADFVVARGRKLFPADYDAMIAIDSNGAKQGLLTFHIAEKECEIITIDAFRKTNGIGTLLLEKLVAEAKSRGCRRIWLITVNDNLDAIRFYQRRGFTLCGFHQDALKESRKLKPSIPMTGEFGIKLEHELEFEMTI